MSLIILISLIFLGSFLLFLSALYLLIEAPAANKARRDRLAAIQEASVRRTSDLQVDILRSDVLSQIPAFNRFFLRFRQFNKLNIRLRQSGWDISLGSLLLVSSIAGCAALLVCLAFNRSLLLAFVVAVGAGAVPFLVVEHKRQRRFMKFQEQFPNAMDFLSRAVRAGHAVSTAFQMIGSEMADPIGSEFRRLFDQLNVGLPAREALENLYARIPLADVHIFVTALLIHSESGGNLAEMLDNLTHVIRERTKLTLKVRMYTAQGRLSLYILTAMPPFVGLALYFTNKEYISRLFVDPAGQKALMLAVLFQLLGFLVIRRIIRPKI
jgi:tight adherence protein B